MGEGPWVACSQWDKWVNGEYTIYNNIWGEGYGTQCIWAESYGNWGVTADHPNTSGIKSCPNAGKVLNKTVSALASCTSSFNVTVPGSGSHLTTYDIWADSRQYEIMIWVYYTGQGGPIARAWNDDGSPVPEATNVSAGSHTWNVNKGNIDGRTCTPAEAELAQETGCLIARAGWVLICGAWAVLWKEPVPEPGSRAVRSSASSRVIPASRQPPFRSYTTITGLGEMRNSLIVRSAQALNAIGGSYGTLSEITFAYMYQVPVVGLYIWGVPEREKQGQALLVHQVKEPVVAIEYLKNVFQV
jgi:uncharacterized protein (TIGR00725 family)